MKGKKSTKLKALRKESRITQEQLAQYLNVTQSLVTKLENGTRSFNVTLADKICGLFGCTEDFLFGEGKEYIPLNFAFRSNEIDVEDLESIAVINKIAMNLRYMNKLVGGE